MKKLLSLLAALLFAVSGNVMALVDDLDGSYAVSVDPANAFTVKPNTWYVMYNVGRKVYVYGSGNTRSSLLMNGSTVKECSGYLLRFVESDTEGKYLIQNADGNYYKDFTYNTNAGTTSDINQAGKFTIGTINNNDGHWYVKGSTFIMDSNGSVVVGYGTTTATLNGNSDWCLNEAIISDPAELSGGAFVNYQLMRGGLFRIQSRGNNTQFINEVTTTHKASTRTRSTAENLRMAQMWIIEHDESGFSLRNAQTGNYMQSDYTCKPSKYYWTIQLSPNNTSANDPYIILCHGTVKSYSSNCANLSGGTSGLTNWYYDNDRNSEWIIQAVASTEVDTATVKANLDKVCNVGTLDLEAGSYYTFTSIDNGQVLAERKADGFAATMDANAEEWNQYWQVVYDAENNFYTLQNLFSGKYLTHKATTATSACGGNYMTSKTSASTRSWLIQPGSYAWQSTYNLVEPIKPTTGVAVKGDQTVNAEIDAVAAQWIINRVDLTDEQLQKAADAYNEFNLIYNTSTSLLNSRLQTYFSDYACTTLKDEYTSMSDDDLTAAMKETGLPKTLINMALKIKNDTWGHREKEFRIYDYEAYSDPTQWNSTKLVGTSYQFSPQTGPTGISVKQGDVVLFFVGSNTPSNSTLTFSSNKDYTISAPVTTLKRGVNVYIAEDDGFLYIHYTITSTNRKLADFQPITIHIEGGRVQGYFDITRGHTNADWKDMVANLFQDRIVHLKNKYYQFNMDYKELLKQISASELDQVDTDGVAKGIEGTLHRWDQIVALDREMINATQFEDRFNCMLSASSSSDGNPYATTYGTYYPGVGTIMNYTAMTHGTENDGGANYWCIAHETGHIHQSLINLAGCTEVSVNFFSHICTWMQGSNVGRYGPWKDQLKYFAQNKFWIEYGEDVGLKSRMYFQLWLYFHLAGNDPTFYPRLFDKFRESPLQQSTDASNPGSGLTDYLKFAMYCCDVAQADLSEFFQFWGFFVPVKNYEISDYSSKWMTTTQAQIDQAIAYMQKYPKKLGNIMFIDERIKKYPADYPGMPAGATRLATTASATPGDASEVGETGMFTDFIGIRPNRKYSCTYRAKTKELLISSTSGSGAVGFKIYNADHKMIYAANTYTIKMPDEILAQPYYVVAALSDGTDITIYDPNQLTPVKSAELADEAEGNFDPAKPAYDLSGQKVANPQKGNIYVQYGKKVKF